MGVGENPEKAGSQGRKGAVVAALPQLFFLKALKVARLIEHPDTPPARH
jgi:hypothetical protein